MRPASSRPARRRARGRARAESRDCRAARRASRGHCPAAAARTYVCPREPAAARRGRGLCPRLRRGAPRRAAHRPWAALRRGALSAGERQRARAGAKVGERALATIDVGSLVAGALVLGVLALVRGRVMRALAAVALVGVSVGSAELLKHGLPRLPWVLPPGRAATIPSGHAAVAVSLGLALVLAAPPLLRPTAALVGAAYAAAVGFSLIALGWHYPSDVAASSLPLRLLGVRRRRRRGGQTPPARVLCPRARARARRRDRRAARRGVPRKPAPDCGRGAAQRGSLVATGALVGVLSLATFAVLTPLLEEGRP